VLVRQAPHDGRIRDPLQQIGAVSRDLVDSMSDIVWSVNPKRDMLHDLTQRMRAFASDDFPARNISFQFRAPSGEDDLKLPVEVRRQIFLIFKESVNNIVRHSQCSHVEIDFKVEKEGLALRLSDNGRGFDCHGPRSGHGLANMSNRARSLHGDLRIVSSPQGTTITLRVPNSRRPG
jgi:signal transduction histidine kinase